MIRSLQATIVGCAILVAGLVAADALAGEPRLLRPGQYHGHEVTAVSGERWLALVRGAGGRDRLVPVTLQVDTVRDELVDEDRPASGKRVSAVPGGDSIVFLVDGVPGLPAGQATTVLTDVSLAPNQPLRLAMRGDRYSLSVDCGPRRGRTGMEPVPCSLVVRHRSQAQVLRNYGGFYLDGVFGGVGDDASPTVIWAGDLDGDGALDLLIDLSDHYNLSRPTLFMSQKRGGRTLLEPVAAHASVGC